MEDAHEPRRVDVRERDPAERVLEEVRDPDHAEPLPRRLEKPFDRRTRIGVREHDEVGMLSVDDIGQVAEAAEQRRQRIAPPVFVGDDSDDLEAAVPSTFRLLGDIRRDVGGAENQHLLSPR